MTHLPSGTVSLLFSDIEGSTRLLSRLGAAYADVLDGHRQVLRSAWSGQGGTELSTGGDSFFVVFRTAAQAVSAAAQAQRALQAPLTGGERVRVRIGIHTGTPHVHHGDYVGMDVHRASRIAASAHGGQVVLSAATAEAARGSLAHGMGLQDLGSHRLKDLTVAEHLFQLTIDDLPSDFPPLRTIGAASSLPIAPGRLVGRDAEVEALVKLLQSPEVRLVTLMGPGGAGKTRLASTVAHRLVGGYQDEVYFVPLAAVTSGQVMWTSIAEALDLPPNRRTTSRLLDHLARRRALLVLDNLEQVVGADEGVTELLTRTEHLTVLATSRRALNAPAEQRYPVPPLTLPTESGLRGAATSGAVQLFVQQAQLVRPAFRLTDANVDDVAAICTRLDGLPLAIELSAARMRLLSPAGLLRRLDTALDIPAAGQQGPVRQRTLRDTIAWSYDLLTPSQQRFFRRLGVISGGATLEAVAAVTRPSPDRAGGSDSLDLLADAVDASLVAVIEGSDGEPRVSLLETIRTYAIEELTKSGEIDVVRSLHAHYYLELARHLEHSRESEYLTARALAETELDNFREALAWTLGADGPGPAGVRPDGARPNGVECDGAEPNGAKVDGAAFDGVAFDGAAFDGAAFDGAAFDGAEPGGAESGGGESRRARSDGGASEAAVTGARLCAALGWLWYVGGYLAEGRRWYERVFARFAGSASSELAACLGGCANLLIAQGDPELAREHAVRSVTMARSLGNEEVEAFALGVLGTALMHLGQAEAAQRPLHESIELRRRLAAPAGLARALGNLAGAEETLGHFAAAEALTREALDILRELGDLHEATVQGQNLANLLATSGHVDEAHDLARTLVAPVLELRNPNLTLAFANTYATILIRRGQIVAAAHLFGAEAAMRERNAMHNPYEEEELAEALALVGDRLSPEEWEHHRRVGRGTSVEELLTRLGSS